MPIETTFFNCEDLEKRNTWFSKFYSEIKYCLQDLLIS